MSLNPNPYPAAGSGRSVTPSSLGADDAEPEILKKAYQINPWERCAELAHDFDEKYCDTLKDELDNLLVFAALFSGILAAFTIESYKWLQPEPPDPPPVKYGTAVIINNLWFASLSVSMGVASVGILCMQWIRTYRPIEVKPTKRSVVFRRQRFRGLVAWHVPNIISLLPVLLQLALCAFILGLVFLLWELNVKVAVVFTATSLISISFVLFTTVTPIIQWWVRKIMIISMPLGIPQCPYQSPQGWLAFICSWWLSRLWKAMVRGVGMGAKELARKGVQAPEKKKHVMKKKQPRNWREFDEMWPKPADVEKYEEELLTEEFHWLEDNFAHDLEGIKCRALALRDLSPNHAADIIKGILHNLQLHDEEDEFDEASKPYLNGPRSELQVAFLQAWYYAAHAKVHPVLDADCIEAKVRIVAGQPRSSAVLPATPRKNGLHMTSLVKEPQLLPQFLRCLKFVAEKGKLSDANQEELWYLIGDIFEYAVDQKDYPGFDKMRHLFDTLLNTVDYLCEPSNYPGGIQPRPAVAVKHLVSGLDNFVQLYAHDRYPPLPKDKAKKVFPLCKLVDELEKRMRVFMDNNLKVESGDPSKLPPLRQVLSVDSVLSGQRPADVYNTVSFEDEDGDLMLTGAQIGALETKLERLKDALARFTQNAFQESRIDGRPQDSPVSTCTATKKGKGYEGTIPGIIVTVEPPSAATSVNSLALPSPVGDQGQKQGWGMGG